MKLYTEEELRKHLYNHDERFFEELTPIELPSDEEIHKQATNFSNFYYDFRVGAEWMKEQILNQNK